MLFGLLRIPHIPWFPSFQVRRANISSSLIPLHQIDFHIKEDILLGIYRLFLYYRSTPPMQSLRFGFSLYFLLYHFFLTMLLEINDVFLMEIYLLLSQIVITHLPLNSKTIPRSEERRVGKEYMTR